MSEKSRRKKLGAANSAAAGAAIQGSKKKSGSSSARTTMVTEKVALTSCSGSGTRQNKKADGAKSTNSSGPNVGNCRQTRSKSHSEPGTSRRDRMSESESSDPSDKELAELVKQMTITPKNGEKGDIPNNVLYYGWFFSPSVSASLSLIAEKYLTTCLAKSQQFERFLKTVSAKNNISDPLLYYTKPSSGKPLSYHATAKFCGRNPCSPYARLVNPFIGKEFSLQIIGMFFTESTYGFRLKLTKGQEVLHDRTEATSAKTPRIPASRTSKKQSEKGQLRISESETEETQSESDSEYYGIRAKPQNKNFNPSLSRAHITLGCAPGVKAMQTGLDLLDIVSLETQKSYYNDVEIKGATFRQYGRGNGDAFVVYPDTKFIANAIFMSVP